MPKVYVDPGHGGTDPGAVSGSIKEKDINLAIAMAYGQALARSGVQVQHSRTTDVTVSLAGRCNAANSSGSDVFVSFHANSAPAQSAKGIEVYHASGSSKGQLIAQHIYDAIATVSPWADRGVKTASFYVLTHTTMPSCLVETGFVSSPEEAAKLTDPAYQTEIAEKAAHATCNYLGVPFVASGSEVPPTSGSSGSWSIASQNETEIVLRRS